MKISGKTPRITVAGFAREFGVSEDYIRQYQRLAHRYNDQLRRASRDLDIDVSAMWKPYTLSAIARSKRRSPEEQLRYVMDELTQRLTEGVRSRIVASIERYADNLMTAITTSSQYMTDKRLQKIVRMYQNGELTGFDIWRRLGGIPLSVTYRKMKKTRDGEEIVIDFSPVKRALLR